MDSRRIFYVYTLCLLAALVTVGNAKVRITSLKVPGVHIINDESIDGAGTELVLDCEYTVDANDKGFVLKWFLGDQPIYQWIPPQLPHSLSGMKNNINVNYTASADPMQKYRALAITRPTLEMTGNYTCSVSSFQSDDKRSAKVLMMRREAQLRVQMEDSRDDRTTRKVQCIATDVFPEPDLTMYIDNTEINNFPKSSKLNETDHLYDVVMFGSISKDKIDSPSSVSCVLSIPNTNYTSRAVGTGFSSSSRLNLSPMTFASALTFTLLMMAWGTAE